MQLIVSVEQIFEKMLVAVKYRPVQMFWVNQKAVICKWILFAGKAFIKGYCCSYNTDCGKTATGFDCALIPSPSKLADGASLSIAFEGFCGGELSTIANSIDAKTVCCK